MSLSKRSIEILIDLVEIKISSMDIADREDARHLQMLERCRAELKAIDSGEAAAVVTFASPGRRPGRAGAGAAAPIWRCRRSRIGTKARAEPFNPQLLFGSDNRASWRGGRTGHKRA